VNQNPGGGPGTSNSGSVSSGSVLTEEKSRGGSGGPYFSSSMQSKQLYTHRPHQPFPSSYSRFVISSWHPLQSAHQSCVSFIRMSTSSHVYRLFLSGEFSRSQTGQRFHRGTSSCCVSVMVFHLPSSGSVPAPGCQRVAGNQSAEKLIGWHLFHLNLRISPRVGKECNLFLLILFLILLHCYVSGLLHIFRHYLINNGVKNSSLVSFDISSPPFGI